MLTFGVDNFTFDCLVPVLEKGMAMQNDIEEYLRPFNISHGRFSIILTLYGHNRSMKPGELAEVLKRKRPTITGMLKKLVKEEYISEVVSPEDGRSKEVQLNSKALDLLTKIIPEYNLRIVEMGKNLTDDEKVLLKKLVNKINI